jgi:fibronectin-binding autotransporter adhesin
MKSSTSKQPRIPRNFIASLSRSLALSTLAIFGLGRSNAADLTWDPAFDGGATGGAGTWNTALTNWWDGAANLAWPNASDVAVFGGAASGVVVINTGTGISAGGLTFNTTGYTISGNIAADTLNFTGATPTVTVTNGADSATISAIIAGTAGITKAGAGTLVLSGANTNSGVVNMNAGTLQIGASNNLGDGSATNTLSFGGGTLRSTATVDLGVNRTIAVGAGGGTLSAATGTTTTVSGLVSGAGTMTAAGGGTVILSAANAGFSGNVTVDSVVGNTTNTTLRLSNASALSTGTVTVNAGVAAAGGNGNQVDLAGVSISGVGLVLNTTGATNSRASLLGSTGTSSWTGGIQLNGDGLAGLNTGTGATLNVDGNVTDGGGGFTGALFVRGTGTGNINGTINLPTGSLAKTDGGTWNINSTGNNWGNTQVSVGTLRMGIANALPSATPVILGQNDANNATLDLNGFSQTIGSLATNPVTGLTGTKTVTSATAATLTINGTTNTTYAGVITGAGLALVKQGTGIQTLTGVNTFAGGTTIDAGGALQLGDRLANNLVLGAGTAITNNGTLIFAPGTTNLTYNNPITGSGNITLDGLATAVPAGITLSGANTGFTGSYTLTQGRMIFASQAAIGATTVPITVNGGATNGGQLWVNGAFSVANPLTLNGYGASETAGNLGAVRMGTGSTLAGAITLGSNASINPQGGSATISGNIAGLAGAQLLYGVPGATAQNGNVTVTSAGGNTYAGGTLVRLGTGVVNANVADTFGTGTLRIESGTVNLNVANALGTTPVPVQLSGGTLRLQLQSTSSTAGVDGLNATYFNFGSNPGIASAQFAGDSLYLNPRSFSRIDAGVNMPQAGASGGLPLAPVAGYSQAGAGAVNNGVLWKGLLNITTAGTYQFKGNNDDNLVLYIDGVQIGTLGVVSGLTNIGTAVTLSAGAHSIVVKHTNGAGGGYARVLYNGGAGSDAPTDEVLGTDAGSLTTGSLGAIALGALETTASSTLDLLNDATTSSLSLGNGTLTIASQTLSKLTVSGATITAATPTLAVQSDKVTFTSAIGESTPGLGLNIAGPGLTEFQAGNTYTGTTTSTGGQLRLNATPGANSIAGNLTLNAANANGDIANVRLMQEDQIADTATVTMTQGILDIGANNETIASLTSNGGRIIGGGTLTVANLGTSTLTGGAINVNLGGAGGLNKTGTGTLALGGAANTYTGVTSVSNGVLLLNSSNLGAGGAGNETNVSATGQLVLNGSSNLSSETVGVDTNAGLRVAGGTSTLGALNFTAGATAPVLTVAANGELILSSAPTSTATISKAGAGTLTFGYDVGATLPTNITHDAGNLGFSGTQSFGAATIGAGRGFKFNSDPGAGVDVTAPAGTTVIAGYAAADQLIARINSVSNGSLALGVNSSANLDFSADAGLSLGAVGLRTYSGTITPGTSGYRLGGGGGTLTLTSPLTGANNLTVDEAGVVNLLGVQTFTGAISVDGAGSILRTINNHQLGNAANAVTLTNGGTLQLVGNVNDATKTGALFHQVGNVLASGARSITIGSGGGTIDSVSHTLNGHFQTLSGVNALTGSGTLTKAGYGELILLSSSNFSGDLVVGSNGGRVQIRAGGELPNVNSVSVGQSGELLIHNNGALGNRQFPEASDADRLRDGAQITLSGGALHFRGNDAVATNEQETVGNVVIGLGRNQLQVEKGGGTGTQGVQLNMTNLTRSIGGGVLNITGTLGTLGTVGGDHARINPLLLNGAALPASTSNGVTLPWATTNAAANFIGVSVGALVGLADAPSTNQAAATGFVPVAATRYTFNGAANAAVVLAAGNQQMAGLRFVTNNAGLSLQFATASDTLFLGDGVVIGDNNNQTRTIGQAATRGRITSGGSAAPAGAKELFFHNNQGTLAVESVIVDNNGAVTVHKGVGGGTLELRAANTYSGGTFVHSGRINANVAGSLGSGAVTVKGAAIELRAPGTTSSTQGFTITDSSELYLNNPTGVFNQPGDRFTLVGSGNMLTGSIANAGQGLASVTRVNTITGPGQVVIPAGTHIRYQSTPNGVVDFRGPQNLGTNADLFFNLATSAGGAQSITVGAGTPWKGLGSSVGTGWDVGTINANSDFTIQGLNRVGGNVTYALGAVGGVGGSYTINNLSGGAINAFLDGRVDLNEDTPMVLPSNLTFVATPGSFVVPNYSQSFGHDTLGMNRASLVAQAGSTIDPGNFVPVGASASMPQGMPYPVPSPVNTFATFEAGSRFLINDLSGIGSTTGGATWTMKEDSITHIQNAAAFLGSNAGLINAGQFVYEPGAIIRYETARLFKHDQFINNETGGKRTILEIFNANRDITDAVNPFIVAAPGTSTVVSMKLTFADGGGITNDSGDRTINQRRGGFVLEDGAFLAATSQTVFNIQDDVAIPAGATVTIGSSRYIDGNPKNGLVQFTGTASNVMGAGSKIVVSDGSAFGFNGTHTFADTGAIDLPGTVTNVAPAGAIGFNPGNGSTLLINTDNYMEVMGVLTGNGAVIGNVATPAFAVGYGATSDFTFAGGVRNANTRNPHMTKVGTTKMTLTGLNDTQGRLGVMEGELSIAGPNGKWAGGQMDIGKGGILTFDNSVNAVADRQAAVGGGANRWLTTLGGGEFRVLGHATDVADVTMFGLANSAGGNVTYGGNPGGFGKVTVSPSGDLSTLRTSVTFANVENFQAANTERNAAWLLRGSGLGGLPGTYSSAGVYTPNAGNPKDGLIFITAPNFTAAGAFGQNGGAAGFISGQAGSPVVPTSGMLLGATSATATEGDFVTIDIASGANRTGVRLLAASEYTNSLATNMNITTGLNVSTTGTLNVSGSTGFQVLKLGNGANVNVSGVLPLLTQPSQVVLNGGGILVPSGATATISASDNGAGADSVFRTAGGVSAYIHAFGDLNVNGKFFSDVGLVKTGAGTASFAAGSLGSLRGRYAVHEGTLNINESVANVRASGVSAAAFSFPHLELTGGTININGNSQAFARLESGNFLAGASTEGGTITSVAPARLTVTDSGAFDGHITGAISLDKVGNNTQTLHNSNPYTGTTTVRQGTLLLRANATLANTTEVNLNYGRLDIDDGHLAYVQDRINLNAVYHMRNGDYVNRGRAGTLTQQHLGTVNLLQGQNLFQTLAGGGGATETYINNLVRSAGASVSFNQNYGFIGTAGNDTTAIRYLINNVGGSPLTLTNGIIGGWAIVNNDHFATYDSVKGVSYVSNTEDGFAGYDSGDVTTATATQNVNDGTAARTIAASKTVNSLRLVPGAAQTITLNAGVTLTLNTGGLLTQANQAISITGGSLTSNSGELNVFVNQNTTTIASQITGNIALTKAGANTLTLTGNNNYTGQTYFQGNSGGSGPSGTVNLNTTGADGNATVAIPGDLHIHQTTVTELLPNQIKNTATVNLYGGSIFNLRDAASTTETLAALKFYNAGGDANNRAIVSRANAQATSALNLTAATPITANNDNPVSIPTISTNVGSVNYTGVGAQTLQLDSPVGVTGLSSIALVHNANIGTVPTGVAEGGLVKAGNGLLVLGGAGTTQFGNPGVAGTEVFNVQSGIVRVDQPGALGPVNAVTTVQSGAKLLLNNNTGVTGSVRLKDGAELSVTLNASTLGAVGSTGTLNVPSGATTTLGLVDYFHPATNVGNLVVNHQLTGSGTINLRGIEYAAGYNGGGLFQLRNEANTFSGTVNVNTNTVFESSTNGADFTGSAFGAAAINLNGGTLRVRDAGNNLAGAQTITYGNGITLTANSYLNFDRINAVATNKTIALGTLTVPSGSPSLWVNNGNGYIASVSQLDGAGTFVKAGLSQLDVNGFAGTFSGNVEIAGPKGLAIQASNNLNFVPATSSLAGLKVGGSHAFAAGKTVNVSGVLEIANNGGEIINGLGGVTTGATTGSVALTNTATVTVGNLLNKGIVAANNSASTITATTISGSGHFHAYGADLTLNGALANDGATPTTLRTTAALPTNAVVLTTATAGTNTGGADVQSGILRIAPTGGTVTNPLGSGGIRVQGAAASVLGAGTVPVAAQSAALEFAGTNITQGGTITNTGTVRVTSGTTTLTGIVKGTPAIGTSLTDFQAATVPGLLEGRYTATTLLPDSQAAASVLDFTAARLPNPGNFGVKLEPRMAQTNVVTGSGVTGWSDNTAFIYTGYFYDADGVFTFMENMDDNTLVTIDGVNRLLNNSGANPWQTVTSTATTQGQRGGTLDTAVLNTGTPTGLAAIPANPDLPAGWHSIEIRIYNGTGGAGPVATNGFANNYGLGLNPNGTMTLDGTQAFRPIDDGTGTLFRTAAAGKGDISLADGTTLNVGGFQLTKNVVLNSVGNTTSLNVTAAGASDAESIQLTGTTASGIITLAGNAAVSAGNLSVVAGGSVSIAGDPGSSLTVTGTQTFDGSVNLDAGTLNLQGVGSGTGLVSVFDGVLNLTGSISGAVSVNAGILTGSSTSPTTGSVLGTTDLIGGIIKPGSATTSATGIMNFDGGLNFGGATAAFDLNGTTAGSEFDQLNVTSLTLSANVPFNLSLGFAPAPMTSFVLIDTDTVALNGFQFSFAGDALTEGETFFLGANEFTFSYVGGNGNDPTVTFVVPEPGSAALLLGGLAMLAGRRRRKQA